MSNGDFTLTEEQIAYIEERGFTIVGGNPDESEPAPYVRLKKERGLGGIDPTFQYFVTYGHASAPAHPDDFTTEELVEMVEHTVGSRKGLDECCGGCHFRTTPGVPIKIFIEDPAWQAVADALVSKYEK